MPRKPLSATEPTISATFKLPDSLWSEFGFTCAIQRAPASAVLRQLIADHLATPEVKESVAAYLLAESQARSETNYEEDI